MLANEKRYIFARRSQKNSRYPAIIGQARHVRLSECLVNFCNRELSHLMPYFALGFRKWHKRSDGEFSIAEYSRSYFDEINCGEDANPGVPIGTTCQVKCKDDRKVCNHLNTSEKQI